MSFDLFSDDENLEKLNIPDAEIFYAKNVNFGFPDDIILKRIIAETRWKEEQVKMYGKTYKQPRLIAWYGNQNETYSYSGIKLTPARWTELLVRIKEKVERLCEYEFNSALINYYRDNNDSIGMHSDDEKELGINPTIASVSFGEKRIFILKSKKNSEIKRCKIALESQSILLMKGETQKNWMHGIEKEKHKCGPRINITFRKVF